MQWIKLKKGKSKPKAASQKAAKSLSILISGTLKIVFTYKNKTKTIVLSKPGEYVYWAPGVSHKWKALEKTTTMTIRWPSIPDDQQSSD